MSGILSFRSFPKSSKAAALLLYNLWNDKGLQGALKKVHTQTVPFYYADKTQPHCMYTAIGGPRKAKVKESGCVLLYLVTFSLHLSAPPLDFID